MKSRTISITHARYNCILIDYYFLPNFPYDSCPTCPQVTENNLNALLNWEEVGIRFYCRNQDHGA